MRKFLRGLVLVFIIIGVVSVFFVSGMSAEQRHILTKNIHYIASNLRLPENFFEHFFTGQTDLSELVLKGEDRAVYTPDIVELPERFHFVDCDNSYNPIIKAEQKDIFKWVDDSGRVHFSDELPRKPSSQENKPIESINYIVSYTDLEIEFINNDALLPAYRQQLVEDLQFINDFLVSLNPNVAKGYHITIHLFEDMGDFQNYRREHKPGLDINTGFYLTGLSEIVVYVSKHEPGKALKLIRHQATHLLNALMFGQTPPWFNEGLAIYLESISKNDFSRQVLPNLAYDKLIKNLASKKALPTLANFLDTAPKSFYIENHQLHMGLSWALVYYLMSNDFGISLLQNLAVVMHEQQCMAYQEYVRINSEVSRQSTESMYNLVETSYPGGLENLEQSLYLWLQDSRDTHYY